MDFNSFTRARQYTYNLILQAHKKSKKKKKEIHNIWGRDKRFFYDERKYTLRKKSSL